MHGCSSSDNCSSFRYVQSKGLFTPINDGDVVCEEPVRSQCWLVSRRLLLGGRQTLWPPLPPWWSYKSCSHTIIYNDSLYIVGSRGGLYSWYYDGEGRLAFCCWCGSSADRLEMTWLITILYLQYWPATWHIFKLETQAYVFSMNPPYWKLETVQLYAGQVPSRVGEIEGTVCLYLGRILNFTMQHLPANHSRPT